MAAVTILVDIRSSFVIIEASVFGVCDSVGKSNDRCVLAATGDTENSLFDSEVVFGIEL